MMCYSCLEKRGDYIKKYINWSLYDNNNLVLKNENQECDITNNILKYHDEYDCMNIVDFNKDIYTRESSEFLFKIDFINNEFEYLLKEKDYQIKDSLLESKIINDKEITLIYKLDNQEKKIIIQIL